MTSASRQLTMGAALLMGVSLATLAPAQTTLPSPQWVNVMPAGPVAGTKITEAYAAMVAQDAFFWAWPLVNVHNRRTTFAKLPEPRLSGPLPVAPPNRLTMLTDYIEPEERAVACPNQVWCTATACSHLTSHPWSSRCRTSVSASGCIRSSTRARTRLRHSARCTARGSFLSAGRSRLAWGGAQRHFYQDLDAGGACLNGANRYTVNFPKDTTPPVNGFWSLILYNQHHCFEPNGLKRYSTGTKNKALTYNPDGSLPIYVQAAPPAEAQAAIGCRHRKAATSRSTSAPTGRK